eukprot:s1504_g14.t1
MFRVSCHLDACETLHLKVRNGQNQNKQPPKPEELVHFSPADGGHWALRSAAGVYLPQWGTLLILFVGPLTCQMSGHEVGTGCNPFDPAIDFAAKWSPEATKQTGE